MHSHRPHATSQPSLFSHTHSVTIVQVRSQGPQAAMIWIRRIVNTVTVTVTVTVTSRQQSSTRFARASA